MFKHVQALRSTFCLLHVAIYICSDPLAACLLASHLLECPQQPFNKAFPSEVEPKVLGNHLVSARFAELDLFASKSVPTKKTMSRDPSRSYKAV